MCAAGGPREHAIQRHRAEHSAARGGGSAWARVDLVASRRQGPRPRHVPHYVETKETQPSASWRPGGLLQRQMTPRAAPGSGPPRAIRRLGGAWSALGRPSRACFQRRFHCVLPVREIIPAPLLPTASWARKPATAVDERGVAAPSAPSEAALMKAEPARLQPYVPEPATVHASQAELALLLPPASSPSSSLFPSRSISPAPRLPRPLFCVGVDDDPVTHHAHAPWTCTCTCTCTLVKPYIIPYTCIPYTIFYTCIA